MDRASGSLHILIGMSEDLILLHGRHRPRCVATVDKRFEYHTLQYMAAGAIRLGRGGRERVLEGRWLWSTRPGLYARFHEWPRGRPWHHRYIAFAGPLASQRQAEGRLVGEPEPVAASDARRLSRLFDEMLEQAARPGRFGRLRAINLLEQILLERAEKRQAVSEPAPAWLEHALAYIRSHVDAPDYAALAAELSMAVSTLRRRFAEATGRSLHRFCIERRIARARSLLGETDRPIKAIADELGYRDVFYFTRQFRQEVGVPPSAFRRSRQD
jgi:AraC-like DNA-binding protein